MQTCRGNWRAPNLFSRLVRDPRVFFHPVELSIQALGPLSNRFQRARVCLGCSDSGRFNYSSPRPLHTRFSSFVYSFCRTRRKPRRIPPSMFFLSFLSPSSSLFPLAVEVTQDQPRETCSLPSFLSFSISLSVWRDSLFFRSLVFSRFALLFFPPIQSSKRQSNHSCCSLNEKYFESPRRENTSSNVINVSWY